MMVINSLKHISFHSFSTSNLFQVSCVFFTFNVNPKFMFNIVCLFKAENLQLDILRKIFHFIEY